MKRCIFKIVLFLLLGAIVNVAVAWGSVVWSRLTEGEVIDRANASVLLARRGFKALPEDGIRANLGKGPGLSMRQLTLDASDRQGVSVWTIDYMAGMPCRALFAEFRGAGKTIEEVYNFRPVMGILIPHRQNESFPRLLPLRPIWPGFAINTVFYAAILWLLFAAPFALRRRLRSKRGLCPACAYPIGASDICTECGLAVGADPAG